MKLAPINDQQIASLVAEAADLLRQQGLIARRLDEIKVVMRSKADDEAAKRPEPDARKMVEFESPAGVCAVIFASETPRLVSGVDIEALTAKYTSVTRAEWDKLFRRRILLAPEWQETLPIMPKGLQRAMEAWIEWEPATARVVFPK